MLRHGIAENICNSRNLFQAKIRIADLESCTSLGVVLAMTIELCDVERQFHLETTDQANIFLVEQPAELFCGAAVLPTVNPIN